ncbi:MAG: hypothetical protein NVSMB39_1880 [Candidatus Saccharimonadales bacterium]
MAPAPAAPQPPAIPVPAATPPPPPQKSASASLATCGTAKFFGVRGSGEKQSDFQGYGETVGMITGALQIVTPGLKTEAINYRAIPVAPQHFTYSQDYVNSVERGVQKLLRGLRQYFRDCPHAYALVAGYSQGAEVVDQAYGRLSYQERLHISSVTLFGDPRFNPDQTLVDQGDFSARYQGIDVAVLGDLKGTVPAGWEARVHSYCTLGDPICNFDLRNLPACNLITGFITCAHGMYTDRGYTAAGAIWARHMLAIMPPL